MTVVAVHAGLQSSNALVAARREIYRRAAQLLQEDHAELSVARRTPDVLDNPLLRSALAQAIGGGQSFSPERARMDRWPVGGVALDTDFSVPVITDPDADEVFNDVLVRLGGGPINFLTEVSGSRLQESLQTLRSGLGLARRVVPALLADLLPHVSLIGILDSLDGEAAVQSATLREFPGFLMLSEPESAVTAAEMLLHESAHARLFDMLLIHDILPAGSSDQEPFRPSWRPKSVRWSMEQCVAALHAYAVLAEFRGALPKEQVNPGAHSLLPHATERVDEIGNWVIDRIDTLGRDAPNFIGGLCGQELPAARRSAPHRPAASLRVPGGLLLWSIDEAGLVLAGHQRMLYVLDSESGSLLKALSKRAGRELSLDRVVRSYKSGRRLPRAEVLDNVLKIVEDLAAQSLVSWHCARPPSAYVARGRRSRARR